MFCTTYFARYHDQTFEVVASTIKPSSVQATNLANCASNVLVDTSAGVVMGTLPKDTTILQSTVGQDKTTGLVKCQQLRNEKLMMREGYSTVNGAQNILLSHIIKVLSASSVKLQLQS
ncbi:uncharacterized protein LOC143257586 [Tachypleus tridentatus]|uniref:uncharacterized protein LOC143257586 n=1 Tax=Tachypleus tridentatus TaxID=6853 RepID=UPI003FD51653